MTEQTQREHDLESIVKLENFLKEWEDSDKTDIDSLAEVDRCQLFDRYDDDIDPELLRREDKVACQITFEILLYMVRLLKEQKKDEELRALWTDAIATMGKDKLIDVLITLVDDWLVSQPFSLFLPIRLSDIDDYQKKVLRDRENNDAHVDLDDYFRHRFLARWEEKKMYRY